MFKCVTAVVSSVFLLAIPGLAVGEDLKIATNFPSEIQSGKQYFLTIRCQQNISNENYLRGLNSNAGYKRGGWGLGYRKVDKAAHYFIVSDSNNLSLGDDQFIDLTKNTAPNISIALAAEKSNTTDLDVSVANGLCNKNIYVYGKDAQYLTTYLAVSTSARSTSFVSAVLALSESLLGSVSQIVRFKPISDEATGHLEQVNSIITAYNTYQDALSGGKVIPRVQKLGVGRMTIKTSATTVTVRVREVSSYLSARGVPFLANHKAFEVEQHKDLAIAGNRGTLEAENIKKLHAACRKLDSDMKKAGLESEGDRAFLVAAALDEHNPDLINVIRCYVAAELEDLAFNAMVRNQVVKQELLPALYTRTQLADYKKKYDTELRADALPRIQETTAEAERRQKKKLNTFMSKYRLALREMKSENRSGPGLAAMKDVTAPAFILFDAAALLDSGHAEGGIAAVLEQLSAKGYNKFNCYFLANTDHLTKMGEAAFGNAPVIMLMHKVDFDHSPSGKLDPANAIVLRGYFDEASQFLSALETSEEPANNFFVHHSTCKQLKKS